MINKDSLHLLYKEKSMKDLKLPKIFIIYLILAAVTFTLIRFDSSFAKIEDPSAWNIISEFLICVQPLIWLYFIKSYIKYNNSRFFMLNGIIIIYLGTFQNLMDEFYVIKGFLVKLEDLLIAIGLFLISIAIILNFLEEEKNKNILIKKYKKSMRDPLTGLYNRYYLEEHLETMLENLTDNNSDISVAFVDIDNFKVFNDTYGHSKGDDLLREIGTVINSSIRGSDLAFRFGGDEFLIIYPNTEVDKALKVTERIKDNLKKSSLLSNMESTKLSLSSGIASYEKYENYKDLIARADKAMYKSKMNGKDKITVSTSSQ